MESLGKSWARKIRRRLQHVSTVVKDRDVSASRNDHPYALFASFFFKILIETLSQQARITPDNVVFAWIVIVRTIKDLRTDTLLRNLICVSHQLLLTDIQQELLEHVGSTKSHAGNDTQRQLPF